MLIIPMRQLKLFSYGVSIIAELKSNSARKSYAVSCAMIGTLNIVRAETDLGTACNGTVNQTNNSSHADPRKHIGYGLTLSAAVCCSLLYAPRVVQAQACRGLT